MKTFGIYSLIHTKHDGADTVNVFYLFDDGADEMLDFHLNVSVNLI